MPRRRSGEWPWNMRVPLVEHSCTEDTTGIADDACAAVCYQMLYNSSTNNCRGEITLLNSPAESDSAVTMASKLGRRLNSRRAFSPQGYILSVLPALAMCPRQQQTGHSIQHPELIGLISNLSLWRPPMMLQFHISLLFWHCGLFGTAYSQICSHPSISIMSKRKRGSTIDSGSSFVCNSSCIMRGTITMSREKCDVSGHSQRSRVNHHIGSGLHRTPTG